MSLRSSSPPPDDAPLVAEDLAAILDTDLRFFRIAEKAGFSVQADRIVLRDFWLWFSFNIDVFRRTAGMRQYKGPQATERSQEAAARFLAALVTLNDFFGVIPCEKVVASAAHVLRPTMRKHPPRTRKRSNSGLMPVSVVGIDLD